MRTNLYALAFLIAITSSSIITVKQEQTSLPVAPTVKVDPFAPKAGFKSVSLQGDYTPSIKSNPSLVIRLSDNGFVLLNGCNRITGRYGADSSGYIYFGNIASTQKVCTTDFDSAYTSALTKAVSYTKSSTQVVLKDSTGAKILTLTLVGDKTPVVVTPVLLTGIYSTNLEKNSKIQVQFTDSEIILTGGCNVQSASYKAFSNGTFTLTLFASTKKACPVDDDSSYTNTLSQSAFFTKKSDGRVILMNQKGKTIVTLTPVSLAPKEVKFDKTYKPNVNKNKEILIKFDLDNKVSILNGCNSHTGTYKATVDGSIEFGPMTSTKKLCENDNDGFYTKPLSQSVSFKCNEEKITLYEKTGNFTLVLTPHVVVSPLVKNLCENVKCLPNTHCEKGKCVATIAPLSVDKTRTTIILVPEKALSTPTAHHPAETKKIGTVPATTTTVQTPKIETVNAPKA